MCGSRPYCHPASLRSITDPLEFSYCPHTPAKLTISHAWQVVETENKENFHILAFTDVLLLSVRNAFGCDWWINPLRFSFSRLKTKPRYKLNSEVPFSLSVVKTQSIRDNINHMVRCQSLWSTASNALCVECQTWSWREPQTGKGIHRAARRVVVYSRERKEQQNTSCIQKNFDDRQVDISHFAYFCI